MKDFDIVFCGSKTVIPAKAGTHSSACGMAEGWVPAFAGTAV